MSSLQTIQQLKEKTGRKEGILQIWHLRKKTWHKTSFVCKSTLLLASSLYHGFEMVHDTEKVIYYTHFSSISYTLKGQLSLESHHNHRTTQIWVKKWTQLLNFMFLFLKYWHSVLGENKGSGILFISLCIHGSSGLLPWTNNPLVKLSVAGWSEN